MMDKLLSFWRWFCAPFDRLDEDLHSQLSLRYNLIFFFAMLVSVFIKAVFLRG